MEAPFAFGAIFVTLGDAMAKFCALYSSSSGNSFYVGSGGSGLLIDAGMSCKAILTALGEKKLDADTLTGILITHEHIDHVKGLNVLLKKYKLPVFASAGTCDCLVRTNLVPPDADIRVIRGKVEVGGMRVTPFATPHDAVEPLGFIIETVQGEKIGIATDLGHITPEVEKALTGCTLVAIESNYDDFSLRCSSYPEFLKERVASQWGHLSNACCATQCEKLIGSGTTRIVLCHLSKENNTPTLAKESVIEKLMGAGFEEDRDYILQVASRSGKSAVITI